MEKLNWLSDTIPSSFWNIIRDNYIQNPCETLSTSFHRSRQLMRKSQIITLKDSDEWIIADIDTDNRSIFIHYLPNKNLSRLFTELFSSVDLIRGIIPNRHPNFSFFSSLRTDLTSRKEYFKLEWLNINYFKLVPLTETVTNVSDSKIHAGFINDCYGEDTIHPQILDKLKEKSGFFDEGWFIIGQKNQPIASAIVLLNKSPITEGYLDWIQVSPKYRGKGFGKQIVSESIRRIINNSENNRIITVVGETNNPTNPLSLYKSLGFDKISKWTLFQ